MSRYNPGVRSLVNKAFYLANLDGGFVIAVQIFAFLCTFFSMRGQSQISLTQFNLGNFIVVLVNMLNLAVIIVRISGLNRGLKYPTSNCYQQGLRRLPSMIALYIIGSLFLIAATIPLAKLATAPYVAPMLYLIIFSILPFGIIACSFVIDREYSPFKALLSTLSLIRYKLDVKLIAFLALIYATPMSVMTLLAIKHLSHYIDLFAQIWLLFCNIIAITVYAEVTGEPKKVDKNVKIMIA